jgi:hypothetical protein
MSHLDPARRLALLGAFAAAAALGACGKTGELQRPGTVASKAPGATSTWNGQGSQDPTRPVNTIDPRDEIHDPSPSRTIPIQGQAPDPTRPGPQGSLPDPYRNPD